MPTLGYQALILLPPGTDTSMASALDLLAANPQKGRKGKLALNDGELTYSRGQWSLAVYLDNGPHVAGEAKEIAAKYRANSFDSNLIALSRLRFDVSTGPDLQGNYLDDFFWAAITLSDAYPGSVIFDPTTGTFI